MLGMSLHTLVRMVHNGLGVTLLPAMAIRAGILRDTDMVAVPLDADHPPARSRWRGGAHRRANRNSS